MRTLAIGFGASSGASACDVVALVRDVLREREAASASAFARDGERAPFSLATVRTREDLGRAAATLLNCDLALFDSADLARVAEVRTVTRSPRAAAAVGTPSVAEAAALAALGPRARLVVARTTGVRCTCALAERTDGPR